MVAARGGTRQPVPVALLSVLAERSRPVVGGVAAAIIPHVDLPRHAVWAALQPCSSQCSNSGCAKGGGVPSVRGRGAAECSGIEIAIGVSEICANTRVVWQRLH